MRGGVLRLPLGANPRSLDPARISDTVSHHVALNIYNGLIELDDSLNLVPSLAEHWEVSDDGLTYTFHLREGVRFADDPCFPGGRGRELEAADVKYSLERIADPGVASVGWWLFNGRVEGINAFREELAAARREGREPGLKEVSGYRVIDSRTFQVRLTQPLAFFPYVLAMSYGFVVPREAVEYYGEDFDYHPVGTGPFVLESYVPDHEIVLARNSGYWERDEEGRPLPYLDKVHLRTAREGVVAFFGFERGVYDAMGIPNELWDKVITPGGELRPRYARFRLDHATEMAVFYYGFLMTDPLFGTNKKLRQALNWAIDREGIIEALLDGRAEPARGIYPPSMPGYEPLAEGYGYSPERARALLAEAGYPEGRGLPELTLTVPAQTTREQAIEVAVQAMLRQIGVRIRIERLSWPQFLEAADANRLSFFRLGWIADYPDPENFLALFITDNFSPHGPNQTLYSNPEVDRLYEEALRERDPARRMRLYAEAERIIVDDAPWIFLFSSKRYRLTQPYVRGLAMNGMGIAHYKNVWLDESAAPAAEAAP